MIQRFLNVLLLVMVLGAGWIAWNRPDWIVCGLPPKDNAREVTE